ADVVVLLGAVLAGAARRVQSASPLPLIDGGRAGALMAKAMAELAAPKPMTGTYAQRAGGGLNEVSQSLATLQNPSE
ncbi:MAG: hypothetical protein AB8B85_23605, partial [Paracoccaceae bacterium]